MSSSDETKPLIKIVPLGGMEEVGRNMTYFEYLDPKSPHNGEIIIVDMGLQFPEENMPGIDYIVPNIFSLIPKKEKILGAFITHGHYDHIGAIPHCIDRLGNPPIYTAALTRGMILKRQEDFPQMPKLDIREVKITDKIQLGCFKIEFFHINHNIPDSMGLAIETPVGLIVHTGDFKFDHSPVNEEPVDIVKITRLGEKGVLVLMADSTDAEVPGYSISEKNIQENLEKMFEKLKGRIIAATFASLLTRVQQIIWLAEKFGRKVVVEGYSMKANVEIAKELGYLKVKKETLIGPREANRLPDNRVLILCTGAQGEGNAVLMRLATGEHRFLKIHPDDTIVFSSSVVPGNERTIQNLRDALWRKGARVIHYQMMDIHAGGHAPIEDLKMMLNLIKPKFFMPIEGNYYMLKLHGEIAESVGIKPENIIIANNGQVVMVDQKCVRLTDEMVPANYVMVDGLGVGDVQEVVLRDRRMLAEDGIFVIIAVVDSASGKVKGSPDIISRGFVYLRESKELLKSTRIIARKVIEETTGNMHPVNWDYIKNSLRDKIGKFLFQKTSRRPMVLPVVIEV